MVNDAALPSEQRIAPPYVVAEFSANRQFVSVTLDDMTLRMAPPPSPEAELRTKVQFTKVGSTYSPRLYMAPPLAAARLAEKTHPVITGLHAPTSPWLYIAPPAWAELSLNVQLVSVGPAFSLNIAPPTVAAFCSKTQFVIVGPAQFSQ